MANPNRGKLISYKKMYMIDTAHSLVWSNLTNQIWFSAAVTGHCEPCPTLPYGQQLKLRLGKLLTNFEFSNDVSQLTADLDSGL